MLRNIKKISRSPNQKYSYSVLVPTWNNLGFLKLCIESIRKNSSMDFHIIVIINDGRDGTREWVIDQKEIDYVDSVTNIGICYGLNIARSLVKSDYIVYVNDDMYLMPAWDKALFDVIKTVGSKMLMLSGTMVEPVHTGNPCVIVKDFGRTLEEFREDELLSKSSELKMEDWSGSTWPPNIMHTDLWDMVGGMSTEFSPGMYSDPDLSMKLYNAGVRYFRGVGNSLVYHFGSKTTRRLRKSFGKKIFVLKWGITARSFTENYLRIGKPFAGPVSEPGMSFVKRITNKIKRIKSSC